MSQRAGISRVQERIALSSGLRHLNVESRITNSTLALLDYFVCAEFRTFGRREVVDDECTCR